MLATVGLPPYTTSSIYGLGSSAGNAGRVVYSMTAGVFCEILDIVFGEDLTIIIDHPCDFRCPRSILILRPELLLTLIVMCRLETGSER